MGIGTLGFLKGASKVALDSIDAREEAEREIKKEEARQRLKAKLDKELALATVTDKQYEERDGVLWMVGYNSNGSKVENSERPASPYEIEKRTAEKDAAKYDTERKSLDLQKLEVDIENTQDTIRSRKDDDRRQAGLANAQIGYYNRGNRPTSGEAAGDKKSLSEVLDAIVSRNDKAITEFSAQEGVPLSTIKEGAWKFAELRLARGDSPLELERNFSNYLTDLRKEAQKRGSRLDRYKKKGGDSDTTGW